MLPLRGGVAATSRVGCCRGCSNLPYMAGLLSGGLQRPLLRGGRGCCTEIQRGCCTDVLRDRCTQIQQPLNPPPKGTRLLHARNADADCRTHPRRALPAMSTECMRASIQTSCPEHLPAPPHTLTRARESPRARERPSLVGTLGMFCWSGWSSQTVSQLRPLLSPTSECPVAGTQRPRPPQHPHRPAHYARAREKG